MKEERDKLRDLLNSNIPANIELGMILMQTVGVPLGVQWNSHHLYWLGDWLESLPDGILTAADIEDKEIKWSYKKNSYKIGFYEMDLKIREFHFIGGTTRTEWNKVAVLLKDVQHASFVKSLYWNFRPILFECTKIITLRLEDTYIGDLAKKISQLICLKKLYLNNCWFEFLPQDIGNLKKLEVLDIRKNKLRVLPASFWALEQLKTLYLGDIVRWEEPKKDLVLKHLETLELNNTQHVPDWVWLRMPNLKCLAWIKTSARTLVKIGDGIGTLKKLEQLILDVRTLNYPSSIGNLTQLKTLEIYNDIPQPFATLPKEWAQLLNLKVLKLRGIFEDLPIEWVAMEQLEVLYLNNKAEIIVPLVYELKNLRRLKIFIGKKTIFDKKITTLVHLKFLELKHTAKDIYPYGNLLEQKNSLRRMLPKVKIKICS